MEREITATSNELVKTLIKLKQKKYRDLLNKVLIEGERFVTEMAERGADFEYILYSADFEGVESIDANCPKIKCSTAVMETLSQTVTPAGVIAVVRVGRRKFALPSSNFLILDRVQDPGNLGTIIRTALAFGFRDIYLFDCVDYLNDKVLRSTMGTIADVRIYNCSLNDLESLKKFEIFVADMQGENINKISVTNDICGLVLGNEANGVSPEIAILASKTVAIPMENDVESLNVAIAGGIIMNKLSNKE